jgi:hypothetical protein
MKNKIKINQDFMFDGVTGHEFTNRKYNPENYKRDLDMIQEIIVHCTGSDSENLEDPQTLIKYDLMPNHISKKGCPFATYHFYINKAGEIFQLVSMNYYTWNCKGHNQYSVAVCINHGGTKNNVNKEQFESLGETIKYIFGKLGWDLSLQELNSKLHFHREYANKLCPGKIEKDKLIDDLMNR